MNTETCLTFYFSPLYFVLSQSPSSLMDVASSIYCVNDFEQFRSISVYLFIKIVVMSPSPKLPLPVGGRLKNLHLTAVVSSA